MKLRLDLTDYQSSEGGLVGHVRALADGELVLADTVKLGRRIDRTAFALALRERVDANCPSEEQVEIELARLLRQAEAELAPDRVRAAPPLDDADDMLVEGYERRGDHYAAIVARGGLAGPLCSREPLSNFTATIVREIVFDDGATVHRTFELRGNRLGQPLEDIRVTAEEFGAMRWVTNHWGGRARVLPVRGARERLRDCILAFSGDVPVHRIYEHTGWRQIDNRWLFLHAGGALGATGPADGIATALDGRTAEYALPTPPKRDALIPAVRASLDLWAVASPTVVAPLLAAVYGAPLAESLEPDFTLWVVGRSGVLKTSIAALLIGHYGRFSFRSVPANWESTVNALERQSFLVKDLPLLIDDYRPPADGSEAAELRRKAGRLLRAVGNRAGRARLRPDLAARPEYWPRGIILVTAEDRPIGESATARSWVIEIEPGMVNRAALTAGQRRADDLRAAGAGYVCWLAGRLAHGDRWLHEVRATMTPHERALGGHLRHPQTLGYLLTAWHVFMMFAQEAGAIDADDAQRRLADVETTLTELAERQAEVGRAAQPEVLFVEALGDVLAAGRGHLAALDGTAPPDAAAWGWQTIEPWGRPRPLGQMLGWLDEGSLYLIPQEARRVAGSVLCGLGAVPSGRGLRDALRRAGFLQEGNKDRGRRHNIKVDGTTRDVVRLSRAAVMASWSPQY